MHYASIAYTDIAHSVLDGANGTLLLRVVGLTHRCYSRTDCGCDVSQS